MQAGLAQRGLLNNSGGGRERAPAAQALPGRPRGLPAPPAPTAPAAASRSLGCPPGELGVTGGGCAGKRASPCIRAFPRGLEEDAGMGGGGLSVRRVVVVWVNSRPPSTCPGLGIKDGARQGTCGAPGVPVPAAPPLRARAPGSPRARAARCCGLAAPRCRRAGPWRGRGRAAALLCTGEAGDKGSRIYTVGGSCANFL